MFLLTVGASCWSDSYDADPWDDTPPVTVDFNFVKPPPISTQIVQDKVVRGAIGVTGVHPAQVSRELEVVPAFALAPNQAQPGTPLFSPLRT